MPSHGASARDELVRLLRLAYSGEWAAALAYRGHARSVSDPDERREIERIGQEELDHRACVGRMLEALGTPPSARREAIMGMVGGAVALFCQVGGWFSPMYGAGRLESQNIREYEAAARAALQSGNAPFVEDLLRMAETEWDHERYFRLKASSHWLWRLFPGWIVPPSKERIRESFAMENPVAPGLDSPERLRTANRD